MKLIYVPCGSEQEAHTIASTLLQKELIACANLFPITSLYKWQGEIKQEAEIVLLLKTTYDKVDLVHSEVSSLHSYECPCILTLDGEANDAFTTWVRNSVHGA